LFIFGDTVAADLALTRVDDRGGSMALTIDNAGPSAAGNLKLTMEWEEGSLTLASYSGEGWMCSAIAGCINCRLAALAAEHTSELTIDVSGGASGSIPTPALIRVDSQTPDHFPDNNSTTLRSLRRSGGRRY
jgi:hypothetical protein